MLSALGRWQFKMFPPFRYLAIIFSNYWKLLLSLKNVHEHFSLITHTGKGLIDKFRNTFFYIKTF